MMDQFSRATFDTDLARKQKIKVTFVVFTFLPLSCLW